jgi:hypothetical protein
MMPGLLLPGNIVLFHEKGRSGYGEEPKAYWRSNEDSSYVDFGTAMLRWLTV